jgi:hypothetical protein
MVQESMILQLKNPGGNHRLVCLFAGLYADVLNNPTEMIPPPPKL